MKNLTAIVGIIFGFLSRPCCALPFFYSVFGLGSSSLVGILSPYRHLLLAAAAVFYGISFYLIFPKGTLFNKAFLAVSLTVTLAFSILPYFGINLLH